MNGILTDYYQRQSAATSSTSKIASVSTNSESENGQSTVIDSGVSNKYDTLELSQDYVNYKMQSESSTVEDDSSLLNSTVATSTGTTEEAEETTGMEKPMGAPPPPPPTEDEEEETDSSLLAILAAAEAEETTSTSSIVTDSEDSSTDLSSYSDSELKSLLNDGTITRSEYAAEIASREADSEEATDEISSGDSTLIQA